VTLRVEWLWNFKKKYYFFCLIYDFWETICRPMWVGHNAVAIGVGSSGSAALARAALVQRHSQGGKDPISGSQRGECGTREWRNALAQIYEREA
jgi:hypothetical protein